MHGFLEALRVQRWDDHRYYHHSRINQSLHLVSAISFVFAYVMIFKDPAVAALVGWLVGDDQPAGRPFLLRAEGLRRRQPGHARAQGRDQGRLQPAAQGRADVDLGAVAAPALFRSDVVRPVHAARRQTEFVRHVALIWLAVGVGGLLFRTVQLFFIKDVQTGLVWATKILTDPFHDIKLYHKAPLYLLRGELIDPRTDEEWIDEDAEEAPRAELNDVADLTHG